MIELISCFPMWFVMLFISIVTGAIIIKLARADRIKAGPIEIEDSDEVKQDIEKLKEKKGVK